MAYGVLIIFNEGKPRKVKTLLMTPVFSNNVCQASVRSKKFIHIGKIKIITIILCWFPFILERMDARGYPSNKQIIVAMKERSEDNPNAFIRSGVLMAVMYSNVKAPDLSVNP